MDENEVREETEKHIKKVSFRLAEMMTVLAARSAFHDKSKLGDAEFPTFVKFTPKLRDTTYSADKGSEYQQYLREMKPALEHHYAKNRHHPEFFEDGVEGMDLLDIIEMLCDWWAATERHADGDIISSIHKNTGRFSLSPQLAKILENTVRNMKNDDASHKRGGDE